MKNIYTQTTDQQQILKRLCSGKDERKQNRIYFTRIISAVIILDAILFLVIY